MADGAEPRNVLLQLDTDAHPSSFDAVVALDSGADLLLPFARVEPEDVRDLVYGLLFTRHPESLRHSAVFIGGRNVKQAEAVFAAVRETFFGPFRVSVLFDPGGASTTAAAAVRCAARHVDLATVRALILAGTGPVGTRIARLLVQAGADVALASRRLAKAAGIAEHIAPADAPGTLTPVQVDSPEELAEALAGRSVVVAAGPPGVELLPEAAWQQARPRVLIDCNAVPPLGVEGIGLQDAGVDYAGTLAYGAIGVGNVKMKIHRAVIGRLFERNDGVWDAEALLALADEIEA